tara:strand:+ start:5119 stop:5490 length:372 start_codon:yes stop_codon:yes gene_type:complete
MATKLEKQITRVAEIDGTTYHVSLTPDPEPSITFREKGTRGIGKSIPLNTLIREEFNPKEPINYKNISEVYMTAAQIKTKIAISDCGYKEKVAAIEAIDDITRLAEWSADKNEPDSAIMDQTV